VSRISTLQTPDALVSCVRLPFTVLTVVVESSTT
jgi:hypothetical protein